MTKPTLDEIAKKLTDLVDELGDFSAIIVNDLPGYSFKMENDAAKILDLLEKYREDKKD